MEKEGKIMAWTFGIAAECGKDKQTADSFKNHFEERLSFDAEYRIFEDDESNFWIHITYPEIPESDKESLKNELEQKAIDYGSFRYALAGTETDEFRLFSELKEDIGQVNFGGLIVSEELYNLFNKPQGFLKKGTVYLEKTVLDEWISVKL